MIITKEELAAQLDGIEFPPHVTVTREHRRIAKDSGLVVVYGGSDDIMEFEGAFSDQVDCYGGGTGIIDAQGVLGSQEAVAKDPDAMIEYATRLKAARRIEALWCRRGEYSWTYETDIPHATFTVKEGDELYCLGLVFSVADLTGEVAQ